MSASRSRRTRTTCSLAERLNAHRAGAGSGQDHAGLDRRRSRRERGEGRARFHGTAGHRFVRGGFHGRTHMGMALTGKVVPYKKGYGPFPSDVYNVEFPNLYHGGSSEQSLGA